MTAILQSSTATGLMVTGFAASGTVNLVPALAVMLGANIGSTLIVILARFPAAGPLSGTSGPHRIGGAASVSWGMTSMAVDGELLAAGRFALAAAG